MRLRTFALLVILALAVLAVPLAAEAQPAGKVFQIGYLGNSTPSLESALVEGFRRGLRENGYVEGRTSSFTTDGRKEESSPCPASPPNLFGLKWM